jgi:hypothetical protein
LNTTLQAARKDPDWVSVYRTVAAIKMCPESALMKTSLFHQLWEWLAPAIRKHDLSKFNDLISIMDAVKDSFPKKLEKYLVALISAYSDFDRPPTSTEIKLALNKQPEPRFRETASDQSQINRSLIELGLGWLIAKKKVKG